MPFFICLEMTKMKYGFVIYAVMLSACSSLSNFQEQPVLALSDNTFKTTCNGMAEGWDSCFRKANNTCPNGYAVLDKTQLSDAVHREMTFGCR